jgi:hypothetical protein
MGWDIHMYYMMVQKDCASHLSANQTMFPNPCFLSPSSA